MTRGRHTTNSIDIIEENGKHSIMIVMRCVMSRCTHEQYQQLSTLRALSPHQCADYANGSQASHRFEAPGWSTPMATPPGPGPQNWAIDPRLPLSPTLFPKNHSGTCGDFFPEHSLVAS
jgi:hypothetical protein